MAERSVGEKILKMGTRADPLAEEKGVEKFEKLIDLLLCLVVLETLLY